MRGTGNHVDIVKRKLSFIFISNLATSFLLMELSYRFFFVSLYVFFISIYVFCLSVSFFVSPYIYHSFLFQIWQLHNSLWSFPIVFFCLSALYVFCLYICFFVSSVLSLLISFLPLPMSFWSSHCTGRLH